MTDDLASLTALEIGAAIRAGDLGTLEVVDHFLDRIARHGPDVGAFVTVTAERARAEAERAQTVLAAGDPVGPLHGVPTAIKDLQAVAGVPTKLGSAAFADWVPDHDDHVVVALRRAGMPSLGKTATPELGLPCYTETDVGPPARTPWDPGRSAGGSSGGAGAAVAAGLVPVAQGSDGGGSIRIPASVCGLVGLKPSRGRVSRGPVDLDSSGLSVVGPLATTVRDAAAFLDVVAGPVLGDPDPLPAPTGSFLAACEATPARLRIGRCCTSPMDMALDPAVREVWERTSRVLELLGHDVEDVPAPLPAAAVPLFETVWSVGAATAPVPAVDEPVLRPLTRYLRERGRAASGVDHAAALGRLRLLTRQALVAQAPYDAVLYPTLAQLPRPVGWFTAGGDPAQDFERQKRFTPFTAMINLTGQPAVSLPLGWARDGDSPELPVGMMLVGRPAGEAALLALAAQVEAATLGTGGRPRRAPSPDAGRLP